jgi:hypothetical protein
MIDRLGGDGNASQRRRVASRRLRQRKSPIGFSKQTSFAMTVRGRHNSTSGFAPRSSDVASGPDNGRLGQPVRQPLGRSTLPSTGEGPAPD